MSPLLFVLGLCLAFLTAEVIGLPLALIASGILVVKAVRGSLAIRAAVAYGGGYLILALWVALPAIFPSSFFSPGSRTASLTVALVLLAIGFSPSVAATAVRHRSAARRGG